MSVAIIGIIAAAAVGDDTPPPSPAAALAAIQQLRQYNEARGMDAAKQGMARGGYGFSSVATPYGVYIMAVAPGSRAALAGLKPGDDVLAVNGKSTIGMTNEQFIALVKESPPEGFNFQISNEQPVHLPPLSAQVAVTLQPQPSSTEGCIGHSIPECVEHLKSTLRVDESEIAQQLSRASETDVNGKPLGGASLVTAGVYFTDGSAPDDVIIHRDAVGIVSSVEVSLPGNPQWAKTADEYSKTGLAAAFRAVLPSSCTAAGDLAAFKFFENVVKRTMTTGKKDTTIDETHAETSRMSQSAALPYCGVKVRFSHLGGYDTNEISEHNDNGAYSFSTIDFSR
jgi:membrane-associated protease RseP (regulator of RpoE activity)